jgi:EAL domain-containing protein (putative c-di-GMP-specific phosphodiesterase class I)
MPLEYRVDEKLLESAESQLSGWTDPAGRLREAIEKDEFALYCQPIHSLAGEPAYPMAEILVRMREEEAALLPPGEFLPVLEHFRMMPLLDRWVVRNVLRHIAGGSRIPCFTVNLSSQTLEDPEFVKFVDVELAEQGVGPEALAFEIDESDTLAREQATVAFASAYRALGGKLLVDGFGRRSVSFRALKSIGVHFVKVDGSITRKILSSEVAATKLNAILRIGEQLRYGAVAECVEDQNVLTRLKALGVALAQGFGIHQPQPIQNFVEKKS